MSHESQRGGPASVGVPGALMYEDDGLVDVGGMAAVHRVRDRVIGRRVAMKVLSPPYATNPAEVDRFFDEARLTARLDHPNIVPVHAIGKDGGRPFFTMKLVEGETLQALLRAPDFTPGDSHALFRVLQFFLRACDAIAFAHSRGIVHCDLKPRNVMVGRHGQVYVMDWGLARVLQSASETARSGLARGVAKPGRGEIMGTPEYMSPEQANGQLDRIDVRTDVFGLGAMLYRILAGRPPYQGEDPLATVALASECRPLAPWLAAPQLDAPKPLGEIALKAMSCEPDERYQSVEQLQQEVEAFLRGDVRPESQRIPAGTLVVKEGAPADAAYVVAEGRCVVFRTIDGRRQVLGELGPGDVFGETALFGTAPRTANVEALTPMLVHTITRAYLDGELARTHWVPQLTKALAVRFREVNERATRLELEREKLELSHEIARWVARHGTGSPPEVPWTPLRVALCRRFRRSGAETATLVEELAGWELDHERDVLVLKE